MIVIENDSGSITVLLENGKSFNIQEWHSGKSDFILQAVQPNSGISIRPIQYEMIGIEINEAAK